MAYDKIAEDSFLHRFTNTAFQITEPLMCSETTGLDDTRRSSSVDKDSDKDMRRA